MQEAFQEAGVFYYDVARNGTVRFKYHRTHLPTGRTWLASVWLLRHDDGYKLLDHWNRCKDFKYRSA